MIEQLYAEKCSSCAQLLCNCIVCFCRCHVSRRVIVCNDHCRGSKFDGWLENLARMNNAGCQAADRNYLVANNLVAAVKV